MKDTQKTTQHVLITGATGFIGREVLARLLQSGWHVTALVRADCDSSASSRLLYSLGRCCNPQFLNVEKLASVRGDLNLSGLGMSEARYSQLAESVTQIVHLAASTQFEMNDVGEPLRSNVGGLERLIEFAERAQAPIHHFSTVFVCGDFAGEWQESSIDPDTHRNAYERSKWQGECLLNAALSEGRIAGLTVYRPSITVADGPGGRMPQFHGIRLLASGLSVLRRILQRGDLHVGQTNLVNLSYLRICASADDPVHLVPVGWVADRFLTIFQNVEMHGQVYHLALSDPPSVREFRDALEEYIGVQLGPYTDENLWNSDSERHALESRFYRSLHALRHYFRQKCFFSTHNLQGVDGLNPAVDFSSLWQYVLDDTPEVMSGVAEVQPGLSDSVRRYFEYWLPEKAPFSKMAGMPSLDLTVGFSIADAGDWTCCFNAGHLQSVTKGCDFETVRCGFRLSADLFNKVVVGIYSAQEGFFNDEIEILGDVEAGLKFAMILQEFVQEFPWQSDSQDILEEAINV